MIDIKSANESLKNKSPREIIEWAMNIAKKPIVTTNFKPLSATILHAVTEVNPSIPVIWIDSGYNTSYTYRHALKMMDQLKLNMDIYVPLQSVALRNILMGIPEIDTPEHNEFTEQVKLEPFKRALDTHQPDVWFANLRKGQTEHRNSMDIVNITKDGILKICPFFYWTDEELEGYIRTNNLESEDKYYDPTKVHANRECGLHI